MIHTDRETFLQQAADSNIVPLVRCLMSDQVTPVLAYRRLVAPDARQTCSFLLESVEVGGTVGRHSIVGAHPVLEVSASGHEVTLQDHVAGSSRTWQAEDPLAAPRELLAEKRVAPMAGFDGAGLPGFTGGWCGYAGYDTVRYAEGGKLSFDTAPNDDRGLPDMHFGLFREVLIFDHVAKLLYLVIHVDMDEHGSPEAAWDAGVDAVNRLASVVQQHTMHMPGGSVDLDLGSAPASPGRSNMTREEFESAVETCREYIRAGDAFQIVPSQRFERLTASDPFTIYRALRIVNPSPYMIYMQTPDSILVASSPEILCRLSGREVTSRPLAGTRPRGEDADADADLATELLADEKERAEHTMLVDLARNDLGRVCEPSSVTVDRLMVIEHYSHVMHLSSTVTGTLRADLDCWDALQQSLPVGTVSGAPKVRAMQIIDELEPTRRGPYAGGIGGISLSGDMDIAIALRTMVIPNRLDDAGMWTVHMQAGAGVVLDSDPASEYQETLNKAAAMGRAIDLAESAFEDEELPGHGRPGD